MIPEISALITSSKTAYGIAQGLASVYVDKKVRERTSELLAVLISVEKDALAVQAEHSKVLNEKQNLEEQVVQLKGWLRTRESYILEPLGPGVFAYVGKKTEERQGPAVWVCPYCYNNKKESFLQREYHSDEAGYYFCPGCNTIFTWGRLGRGFQPHDRSVKKR